MKQFLLKFSLMISVILLSGQFTFAQEKKTVTGTVTDKESNQPIVGVSVFEEGTKNGVKTDATGNFMLKVKPNAKISFSTVGYGTQKITYSGQATLQVSLVSESSTLGEVVVTALGIKKDKRDLTYATQSVSTSELTKAKEVNVANSLSGKVAGLDVTRTGSGVTGSTRIILRGERSISGNSQALVVVDGVPIYNNYYTTGSPANATGGRDLGDGISNINPDDIESIDVLKGASAAALYGSRASNGALIINTKKGGSRKGLGINVSSSFQVDQAMMLRDYQQIYGQGNSGVYDKTSETAWGPKMQGQQVATWSVNPADKGKTYAFTPHPNNLKDFYSLGHTLTNGISLNGSTDNTTAYFSYTNTTASGIIASNQLKRHNFNLRVGTKFNEKLSFDSKITYVNQTINNAMRTGETFDNINRQIVRVPSNIDIQSLKSYSFNEVNSGQRTAIGQLTQNYWNPGSNGGQNPYWIYNKAPTVDERNRIMGFASFTYKILPGLRFMIRSGFDRIKDDSELKWYNDTYIVAQNGNYQVGSGDVLETNNDFLFTYNKEFGKNWTIDANLGGNVQHDRLQSISTTNNGLNYPNSFYTTNALASVTNRSDVVLEKQSLYATADIGFKKYLIFTLTGRRDRASTLPEKNNSYNFGAAGVTAILSDMFTMPEFISFAKLRGSIARTGNDAAANMLLQSYRIGFGGSGAILDRNPVQAIPNLLPELTNTQEAGLDMKFFKNRVGLEFTYYNSNSFNQLISVALPSEQGYMSKYINAGNVKNYGFELALTATPVKTKDFTWNTNINYSKNNNKVIEILPDVTEITQTIDFMNVIKVVKGLPFGALYSRGFVRNGQGQVIVDDAGLPKVTTGQTVYLGSTRPRWIGGWTNKFSYKNLSLSVLITARIGGVVSSLTNSVLNGDGFTNETLAGRDGFVVKGVTESGAPNTKTISAEKYWTAIGGRNTPIGEAFTYDASNIRLREVVLSYSMPDKFFTKTPFKSLTFSLTGRNLFFIMNKAGGFDPEMVVGNTSTSVGLESFGLPPTRTYGVNLNFGF